MNIVAVILIYSINIVLATNHSKPFLQHLLLPTRITVAISDFLTICIGSQLIDQEFGSHLHQSCTLLILITHRTVGA